ncbi:MAG: 4-alpha-glucanotransferase [Sphingomonas sp.]
MTALHDLARAAGLQIDWEDANSQPQHVSDDSLRRVLAALGLPAESDRQIAESRDRWRAEADACTFVSADAGEPITLPESCRGASTADLRLEDGTARTLQPLRNGAATYLSAVDQPGYHQLRIGDRELTLAVAPSRCFGIGDAAPGRRLWGAAVQLPALRDGRELPFGDFGTLAATARSFAAAGADALAISPTHALFPADASRFSPYAPSSRLFLNILFGDPALIGQPAAPAAAGELIDWEGAIPARIAALRHAFANRSDAVRDAVAGFRARHGAPLEQHAVFDALHAHYFPGGATGWQGWPEALHDPTAPAVAEFAASHRDDVEFLIFAQWLAEASLEAAQQSACDAGMAVGLIADLAVGMDGGGSHAWSRRDELLTGLSIGAPPDLLGPGGQDWGITSFSPMALRRTAFDGFIRTLRAQIDRAGGIRIDHALGLRRLWVVPHGASAVEGAYLTCPLDDMLRILAIESRRAQAIVIGEDLGTVPEGLQPKLEARGVLGMRVLWFERDEDGGFIPPAGWTRKAVAMTGTHDLVTVAGWWTERDIDWAWKLDRTGPDATEAGDREQRAADRELLWQAFEDSGAASGDEPAPDEPGPVVDAALAHIGSTPCDLAIAPMEDVIGAVEQPNLPGTTDQHPNWRRRMPESTERLLARSDVAERLQRLDRTRRS